MKICTLFGIPIRLHWSFLVFLVFVGLGNSRQAQYILMITAGVIIHELGHALAARRYGCRTRDILMTPIGGMARLERMPARARQEITVALAGPAVSLFLGLAGLGIWRMTGVSTFGVLGVANLFLGLFNLLPAFPMDGGRVLRAFLAIWLGRLIATRLAVAVGGVFTLLFVVFGIVLWQWGLLVIGIFIWLVGRAELENEEMKRRSPAAFPLPRFVPFPGRVPPFSLQGGDPRTAGPVFTFGGPPTPGPGIIDVDAVAIDPEDPKP